MTTPTEGGSPACSGGALILFLDSCLFKPVRPAYFCAGLFSVSQDVRVCVPVRLCLVLGLTIFLSILRLLFWALVWESK